MKNNILIILSFIFLPFIMNGQDITFSQPNESPIILNPANAGAQYDLRVNANYRQQWRSVTSPYKTIVASVDGKALSQGKTGSSLGAGLTILSDGAGEGQLVTNQVNLCASGKVFLGKSQSLSVGIYGGVVQRHISTSKLTWGNQYNGLVYDSSLPTGENFSSQSFINGDFGTGIQWSYGKGSTTLSSNDMFGAQAGISVYHVNSPRTGFYEVTDKRSMRYLFHFSGSYGMKNTNMQISPLFLYEKQGTAQMIYFGTFLRYKLQESSKYTGYLNSRAVSLGGFLRGSNDVVIAAQCEIGQIGFGISYDINISSLSKVSSGRGGFEISIKYLPIRSSNPSRLI
jgi:type IX secretion system PorP/SprF family membrane protein